MYLAVRCGGVQPLPMTSEVVLCTGASNTSGLITIFQLTIIIYT